MHLNKKQLAFALLLSGALSTSAQKVQQYTDSTVVKTAAYTISINKKNGTTSYRFSDGTSINNATASFIEKTKGTINSTGFQKHTVTSESIKDKIGEGIQLKIQHSGGINDVALIQLIKVYKNKAFFLISTEARSTNGQVLESSNISPLTVLPVNNASIFIPGNEPRVLDVPFDNDNWVKILATGWNDKNRPSGTGYEFISLYDNTKLSGFVAGTVNHDFWKTGIRYGASTKKGILDSLIIYGGAATPDNRNLPMEYGGFDGTHDVVAHGSMKGSVISSPLVLLTASAQRTAAFDAYAKTNVQLNGALEWEKPTPFYWNSFGVEGVLGYEKKMMPPDVPKIVDYLASLKNFSDHGNTYLSIDSYDQGIYTTDVLKSIGDYAAQKGQHMGFYFIPFAVWTWKTAIETDKLQHTDAWIRDVTLKDSVGKTIIYKDGEFGAYPLDPTHPATRQRIIGELLKAKAINAKFLKIDFLSAGAMESTTRYDAATRSGMQAYSNGMRMLKSLIDSVLGPDIFITQAISPMFPYQYTHTRFLSTDIYSHLRDDLPGFPHYGSTATSMISSSHLGWTQGNFWPYTNMDVVTMKNFQKHEAITEQDLRVRLITMITMGSLLGDGSDFRDAVAAERGQKYLNNKNLVNFFAKPKAFTPLRVANGLSQDQQISFYLPGDTLLIATINFDLSRNFEETLSRKQIGLQNKNYKLVDFFSGNTIGNWNKNTTTYTVKTATRDAQLLKLIPIQ